MFRVLAVVVAALVFAGIAGAVGPSVITVAQGTLIHGNAASLNAVDGDTLDISSVLDGTHYVVAFQTQYTNPDGFHQITVHLGAWASRVTKCVFFRQNQPRVKIKTTLTTGTFDFGDYGSRTDFNPFVKCKAPTPFTIHFDRLTADTSP